MRLIRNVHDRRHEVFGTFRTEEETVDYDLLTESDVGRTVIYVRPGLAEAGTLSSYRNGLLFVRFTVGDTAAACRPQDCHFAHRGAL